MEAHAAPGEGSVPGSRLFHESTLMPQDVDWCNEASLAAAQLEASMKLAAGDLDTELGDLKNKEQVRSAFRTFETKAHGTVRREFVEKAFQRMGGQQATGKASCQVLDPFTDARTGAFRYEDFLRWLYSSDNAPPGDEVPPTSTSLTVPAFLITENKQECPNHRPHRLPPLRNPGLSLQLPQALQREAAGVEEMSHAFMDGQVPTPQLAFGGRPPPEMRMEPPRTPMVELALFQAPHDDAPGPAQPPVPRFLRRQQQATVPPPSAALVGEAPPDTILNSRGLCGKVSLDDARFAEEVPAAPELQPWHAAWASRLAPDVAPGAATRWPAHECYSDEHVQIALKPPQLAHRNFPPPPDLPPSPLLASDAWDTGAEVGAHSMPPPPLALDCEPPVAQHRSSGADEKTAVDDSWAACVVTGGGESDQQKDKDSSEVPVDAEREWRKALYCGAIVLILWALLFVILGVAARGFEDPVCPVPRIARSCKPCGEGLIFLPWGGEFERSWPDGFRVVLYFVAMIWLFQGIGVICDKFMEGIEEVTSTKRVVWVDLHNGARRKKKVKVWNGTIANLTLMALGSSAPEILLSIIETVGGNYYAGELGPSTIVGSAAFNLMIITAVCLVALGDGEIRRIHYLDVFVVTASFSLFAYVWMVFILQWNTPDLIERWEALVTFLLFPALLIASYAAERGWLSRPRTCTPGSSRVVPGIAQHVQPGGWTDPESQQADEKRSNTSDKEKALRTSSSSSQRNSKTSVASSLGPPPCKLGFESSEVFFSPTSGSVAIPVTRSQGAPGTTASCRYETRAVSAQAGRDFTTTQGQLFFEDGVDQLSVKIDVLRNSRRTAQSQPHRFRLCLLDPSSGAEFDFGKDDDEGAQQTEDGGACCEIVLDAGGAFDPSIGSRLLEFCHGGNSFQQFCDMYREQFVNALYCNGSAEEQATASAFDWVVHLFGVTWKVAFAVVPPGAFCGGWLCFAAALIVIGGVTATVGDVASLLGCSTGFMTDDITALTLVALGTSLPDTFASKLACVQDDTADNSVGNITGSNSVNVFLGVGVPYTMAAFYWEGQGVTQEWRDHLWKGQRFEDLYLPMYPQGGFIVPSESLGISVIAFTVIAVIGIGMLMWRRVHYGGELGGPKFAQYRDAGFLIFLWIAFLVVSIRASMSTK